MNPFEYTAVTGMDAALAGGEPGVDPGGADPPPRRASRAFLAGGTNLLDLMKENLVRPARLVDINRLPLDRIETRPDGGLRLGALARNAATAYHPLVRERYPLLANAILAGASPQIRNMASNGGNLLQRTRCYYFYDAGVPCNKRAPGSGCPAIDGLARQHAILGASEHCIATHPSDMCVALAALAAQVQVQSPRGARSIPFAEFHRLPGDQPERDTTLEPDELIVAIELPPAAQFAAHSAYLKIRERASYAFALASVAAALDLGADGRIRAARIAVGGVAHKPWRVAGAESLLSGEAPTGAAFARAADAVLEGAVARGVGLGSNGFKIPLARRVIVRGLEVAARGTVGNTSGDTAGNTRGDTGRGSAPP
jgi:xanthine dehydrogenase YagS FAD-binding subunit